MIKQLALATIRLYQIFFSYIFGPCCRFYPSCSTYAEQSIQQHGIFKGVWLTTKRITKCHPFHSGGVDLVPPNDKFKG